MLSVLAVVLTLALVMFLAFKRVNIVAISVLCAILLGIFDGQVILSMLSDTFMPSVAGYIKSFLLLFTISALFGKVMEVTGAAESIARFIAKLLGKKYAIIGLVLSGAVLVYGGIASLVVAFTLYPIALALFKEADLPRKLIPGAIAAGCFTFAASAFPGTPQQMNVIPIQYIGTDVMAAPLLGIICGIIGLTLACIYMYFVGNKARSNGEHFEATAEILEKMEAAAAQGERVKPFLAFLPIITIIALLIGFRVDAMVALLIGTILCGILLRNNVKDIRGMIHEAVISAGMTTIYVGAIVGYGAVVKSSAGFEVMNQTLLSLNMSPLTSFAISTTAISGIAGSGSGGLGITMASLTQQYLDMGISAELLHRVGALSAIGLDSLPHNGGVIALLSLCGMTHKDSYKHIFVTTVVITLIVMVISVVLANIGIS